MTTNIVFIDSRVASYETLIASLGADTEWVLINPDEDGLLQMQRALMGYRELDTVQVVSHGSAGTLYLGSTVLESSNLESYETQLQLIGAALKESGDILLYGCNVAEGSAGVEFINSLSNITGADVAASDDLTGSSSLGGDWELEVATGTIDNQAFLQPGGNFDAVLATPTSLGVVSSVSLSGDQYLDALLWMSKWGGSQGSGVTLTYSFPDADSYWSVSTTTGYGPSWDTTQEPWSYDFYGLTEASDQAGVQYALATWSSVADISFVQVADTQTSAGDLRFAYTGTQDPETWASAFGPSSTAFAGDVWLNYDYYWTDFLSFAPGTIGSETLIHEIGHALGLKHPFYAKPDNPTTLPSIYDSMSFTIMSYNLGDEVANSGDNISIFPTTPMSLDIRAIQYLYGANTSYHAGNDTYAFSSTGEYFQCIWDAGGTDTIEYSGSESCEIDLNPGAWSDLGIDITYDDGFYEYTDKYNVQIYSTVVIENAIGGTGIDLLIGNDWANRLTGNGGNDILDSSQGNDTLNGGTGADTMKGGIGNDIYVVDNIGDIVTELSAQGTDTVQSGITYTLTANVESLTLSGTAVINGSGNGSNNIITGNSAANKLNGLSGNDTLIGGTGKDVLTGGLGSDFFVFNSVLNASTNIDTITDYTAAYDTIRLENSLFTKLATTGALGTANFKVGAASADANDFIVYNSSTGALYYDADGSGAGAATQFATVYSSGTTPATLSAAEFVVI